MCGTPPARILPAHAPGSLSPTPTFTVNSTALAVLRGSAWSVTRYGPTRTRTLGAARAGEWSAIHVSSSALAAAPLLSPAMVARPSLEIMRPSAGAMWTNHAPPLLRPGSF